MAQPSQPDSCPNCRPVFKGVGLRHTRQRELIYAALAATTSHPTAEELFVRVRADEPGLSLATVYNTLDAFCTAGLVRKLPAGGGKGACRFDADQSDHIHLALPDGRVVDLPDDLAARIAPEVDASLLRELSDRLGIDVRGLTVQVSAQVDPPSPGPCNRQRAQGRAQCSRRRECGGLD